MLTLYTAVGILRFQDSIKEHKTPTVINNRQEYGLTEEEFFLWSSLAFQIRQIHELQSAFSERLKKHHRSENIPIEPYLNRLLLRGLVVKGGWFNWCGCPVPPLRRTLYQPIAGQFFSTAFYLHLSLHEEKTAHKGTDPLSKKAGTDCYRGHGTPNSKKSTDFYGRACNLCRTGHPSTKYRATFDAAL